ncbi:hypothetical protein ATCC90586_001103 [Pythium insidiosum]|nr:hypothetical protein ATCC90586_001103 [Pythium insidiosum]
MTRHTHHDPQSQSLGPPSGVQIFIPAALNRPTHTLYSICVAVQPTLQEWTVNRRYSQFLQLRKDMIAALTSPRQCCPGCASFGLALRKFPFPMKTWIRTNSIVRRRVKSLTKFLELVAERLYNDLPKCHVCGDKVKKMVRPFLIRGAQPIGSSTIPKIQHSLSLQSYAIVHHRPRPVEPKTMASSSSSSLSTQSMSQSHDQSFSTHRTMSDPLMEPSSPTDVDMIASTRSDDSYGQQYGDEMCNDAPVPLEEAMKQVVLLKRESTVEEVAFRLSSMWSAYDLRETLKVADDLGLRLSSTMEEDSAERDDDTDDEYKKWEVLL